MGPDHHLPLIASPPSPTLFGPYHPSFLLVLRSTPAEFSLERVRSVSVVGLYVVSALWWLVSYSLDLYCCLFVCFAYCLVSVSITSFLAYVFESGPSPMFVRTVGTGLCTLCLTRDAYLQSRKR
jgi:hypothetical protein